MANENLLRDKETYQAPNQKQAPGSQQAKSYPIDKKQSNETVYIDMDKLIISEDGN